MKKHEWRETVDDGAVVQVRATQFAGRWTIQTKGGEDDGWTAHNPAPLPLLRSLREKLFNKYQRRRVGWETVASVEKLIESHGDPSP